MENGTTEEKNINEIEKLKLENETLQRLLKSRDEAIAGFETTLKEKDGEIAVIKTAAEDFKVKFDDQAAMLGRTVTSYRELAVRANPGFVTDMIKGNTIDEIDASIKSAKELVEKVRQEVSAENARVRVPAGAPPRALPDLSALSAREKIKLGVENT